MKSSDSALLQALLDAARGIGIRGGYKPGGTSGAAIRQILRQIKPSMYPLSGARDRLDLDALAYSLERLPAGIEACPFIDIVRDETPYKNYPALPVPSRREIAYRVSPDQMVLVVKGSKIRILDRITMITCVYIEGDKIGHFADSNELNWQRFEKMLRENDDDNLMYIQLSRITGNSVDKIESANRTRFNGRLPTIIYELGRRRLEAMKDKNREMTVTFSREFLSRPSIGDITEKWVQELNDDLNREGYARDPVYFISGNMDSFLGVLTPYFPGPRAGGVLSEYGRFEDYLDQDSSLAEFQKKNTAHPGVIIQPNAANTGLGYQIFFLDRLTPDQIDPWLASRCDAIGSRKAALVVMDYPFGDDAFYYMNDICKTFRNRLRGVGVMGRAAVFHDDERVCLIPKAFVRQGDPQSLILEHNRITPDDFADFDVTALSGNMLTVLGTFLQTRDVLEYFTDTDRAFGVRGLEMEGIHFANAIESARLRRWIADDLPSHFAYYKSDNPFDENATLAKQPNMGERIIPKYALTLALIQKLLADTPRGSEDG